MRIPVVSALFVFLLLFTRYDWFWIALATSLAGEFIQLWCFASLDKNKTLACNGPYKYVRNPMYLGRFFIVIGYILLLRNWFFIVLTIIVYGFYMVNRVKREEKILGAVFGPDYISYCRQINRFLPSFLRSMKNGTAWYWNWRLFRQNNGMRNLFFTLISYAVIWAWLKIKNT